MAGVLVRAAEDALEAGERAVLDAHLAECDVCRDELAAQRTVRRLLIERPASPLPAGF